MNPLGPPYLRLLLSATLLFLSAHSLPASILSGLIKDPSGAPTPHARVEISGGALTAPISLETDAQGRFLSPDLKPGSYTLKISAAGFEPSSQTLELTTANRDLVLALGVATVHQEVTVEGKLSARANNDPSYRQLRDVSLGTTYHVHEFVLKNDVGTLELNDGTLTLLNPVQNYVTGAIFVGQGRFHLKPVQDIDRQELSRRVHADQVDEEFSSAVFRYTGDFHRYLLSALKDPADQPKAASIFSQWKDQIRTRHLEPHGFTDGLFNGSDMDNTDAELLSWLYNPVAPHTFFQAYIHGARHKDLRFLTRTRGGAVSGLGSPEEIALVNFDPESLDDGIWYLNHRQTEFTAGTASSFEERRFVRAQKFKIETVIGANDHLTSIATVTFQALIPGERLIRLELLPNLRVSRVTDSTGKEISYIQEGRKADGSFYAILPQAAEVIKDCSITVEYAGDKVITKAGTGSFYIGAREAWYPNLNGFYDHALYDLTFRVPKKYQLISVGTLDHQAIEEGQHVTHWVTPKPVAVAGFNYGDYKKVDFHDDKIGINIAGYYLTELPDMLRPYPAVANMAPKSMTNYALDQTRAQMELCTLYFGKSPFDAISITEQPNFSFGQSWPNLVYLPISAYIDSTQRW